jgi:tetrathionate reductase subunit B
MKGNSQTQASRRQFLKVFGGILGLTAGYGLLLEAGQDAVRELVARSARAADPGKPQWAFVVDATKCIGCGKCVVACKRENRVPLLPECNRTWVERWRIKADGEWLVDSPNAGMDGFVDIEDPSGLGDHGSVEGGDESIVGGFFVPKLCNQCDSPPCVQVCPVSATYKTEDGVILVNQEWCIGCRYCIQACPYGARYIVPDGEVTPTGQVHVADKCTWCYHRIRKGKLPACVEVCPVGARVFGDVSDPDSPVSEILREQQVKILKPELGTKPKVFYIGLGEGVR